MFHSLIDGLAYWIVRGLAFVVQRIPVRVSFRAARALAGLAYFIDRRRWIAYVNLKAAFPETSAADRKRWVKEMFQHLGMNAIEIMRFPILRRDDLDRMMTMPGSETYLKFRQSGRGLIMLTSHSGNWEFAQIVEGLRGRPLAVLARRQKYRRLDHLLNSFRQYHGGVYFPKGAGTRDLIRILRKGGCIAVVGDQSGGDRGVWVRFFGRLTTSPRGPIELALKYGATIFPVFPVRQANGRHDICIEPPFPLIRTGDREKDVQVNTQNYLHLLEAFLKKYPNQWLWGHKRWKRTRTKRITILSDGKPGHVKQSESVVKSFTARAQTKTPPYEIWVEKIEIQFRNEGTRRLFPFFSLVFLPWAQGRLHWLRLFFTRECAEQIERTNPDIVISTGACAIPLNLCLSRENLAKSVVVMKPSFPFNFFRYDLALIPVHDRGLMPRGALRVQGSVSEIDSETLEASGKLLARSIRDPEKVRFSLFLGGETGNFKPSPEEVEKLLREMEKLSREIDGNYLVTTSRRTPEAINEWLRNRIREFSRCQLCVIASEDPRPEVVPGMMALADFLIVTEDSLSMITEAVSSGKKVVVVRLGRNGLSSKHDRFQAVLEKEWGVPVVKAARLSEILRNGRENPARSRFEVEREKISEKLETLL